jgi:hypothetical protein
VRSILAAVAASDRDPPAECESVAQSLDKHLLTLVNFYDQRSLDLSEQKENNPRSESRLKGRIGRRVVEADKRSAWLRKLDEECPYQVVLPRAQLTDDSEILDFLLAYVGKFDMYVEDDYAAFVRYCFEDPLDAEIFRARFEPKHERFRLAG